MPEITIQEGDFGADQTITFGANDLYLPDPERPGLTMMVPLVEVAEIDSLNHDGLRPVKEALKLGAKGLLTGPAGVAAGFHSVTKVKDVVFNVLLRDGRQFVAIANAKTYAELRSAHLDARVAARTADMPGPADDIIAKYIDAAEPSPGDAEPEPVEPEPVEPEPVEPEPVEPAAPAERPAFGRRRPAG